jgi:thioredoxin-like negative regulator of GroEL
MTIPIELTYNDFSKDGNLTLLNPKLQGNAVILFWHPGCGHCVNFKPNFEDFARKCTFAKVGMINTAENQDIGSIINQSNKFRLNGVPMVVSYNKGNFFSEYGQGSIGKHAYRSSEDLLEYASEIGNAEITYTK